MHNNYSHNLESNSIVLFGANDCTIGLALSLEPRSPSLTGAFTSRIVMATHPFHGSLRQRRLPLVLRTTLCSPSRIVQLYFFASFAHVYSFGMQTQKKSNQKTLVPLNRSAYRNRLPKEVNLGITTSPKAIS